ncbi:MAG: DUF3999 family protein [Bacteroidia bacterium]|nr:DUF3999 family protein [Bacteroidia bacterium]
MKQIKIVFALFILSFGMNAQLSSYDYFRELKPVTENGYYQIKIGSSVLDRQGYYRVYELSAKDTLEVPHVIGSNNWDVYDRKYFKDLKIIDKSYESGKYSYATLVVDTNLIYTSVYLNFSSSSFFKDVTLEGSSDNKNWKTIIQNEKLFHYYRDPYDHYYRNKIVFEACSFKYLRIKLDDSDSEKLDLVSASIPLVKEEIVEDGELVESKQTRIEDKQNKQTIVECSFARSYFITGLQVNIENEERFRRNVQIEFYNPVNGKEKWVSFGSGVVSSNSSNKIDLIHYNPDTDFEFKSAKMRIIIDNLDNQPLGKISIKSFTHEESIKLKLQNDKKYVLAYGKTKDAQPQYDLEYFKYAIPLNLSSVELGIENKIPHVVAPVQQPLISNKLWIWVALIACVLVIGLFTFKLMKPQEKES